MNLEEFLRLETSQVVRDLREAAADDLRVEAVQALVYARVQELLLAVRAEADELEAIIEESEAARPGLEAELEGVLADFAEARENYGQPPRAETEAAMNAAQGALLAVQVRGQEHRSSASMAKFRLERVRDLEAVLAAVEEPELDALRLLAAMI